MVICRDIKYQYYFVFCIPEDGYVVGPNTLEISIIIKVIVMYLCTFIVSVVVYKRIEHVSWNM